LAFAEDAFVDDPSAGGSFSGEMTTALPHGRTRLRRRCGDFLWLRSSNPVSSPGQLATRWTSPGRQTVSPAGHRSRV